MRNIWMILAMFIWVFVSCVMINARTHDAVIILWVLASVGIYLSSIMHGKIKKCKQAIKVIRTYKIPARCLASFREKNPQLCKEDVQLVKDSLKQFFMLYAIETIMNKKRSLYVMPSKITHDLWHELSFSSSYEYLCRNAFGKKVLCDPRLMLKEAPSKIDYFPQSVTCFYKRYGDLKKLHEVIQLDGLPLLFAIDKHLNIADGFEFDKPIMERIKEQISRERQMDV